MAAPLANRLHRLVYASMSAGPLFADKLDRILLHARATNTRDGVTGMLLFHEGRFLQVLEGPRETLLAVLERIRRDRTHKNLTILEWGPADARLFETPMGYLAARNFSEEQRGYLRDALELAGVDAVMPADELVTHKRVAAVLKAFAPVAV
jgi:hypothetical protein